MKEARTTRVVGPHTEFQASGARRSAARRNLRPQGPLMELLSAMISFPLRIANVNAIKCRARCAAAQTRSSREVQCGQGPAFIPERNGCPPNDAWRVAGREEKYLEAYFMVEALELQLDEQVAQHRQVRP